MQIMIKSLQLILILKQIPMMDHVFLLLMVVQIQMHIMRMIITMMVILIPITGDVIIDVNTDDGSCVSVVEGCIDPTAFNYSSDANVDDGSCYPIKYGCLDETAYNYNDYDGDNIGNELSEIDSININTDNGNCFPIAYGCTDCDEDDGTPIAE